MRNVYRRHLAGPNRAGRTPAVRPRGAIMVITIAVILILSSLLLVFVREMRIEAQTASMRASNLQAAAIARGALAYANNHLIGNQDPISLDTEMTREAVPLGDGYFWIMRPDVLDETKYAFGLTDEASKLNINTATYNSLLALPNMTTDLAASIIDWVDADDDVSNQDGAENEYYLTLPEPYYCKNAAFETPEEVLLVKGATNDLLYGVDANHNGVVDASEAGNNAVSALSSFNGNARCGVMKYMTIYSQEPNTSSTGKARTNIANASNQQLSQVFGKYVSASRLQQIQEQNTLLSRVRGAKPFKSTFDFYFKLQLQPAEFSQILGNITVNPAKELIGLVNVNTAPKEVLSCLPGLEPADGDALIARRTSSGTDISTVAWVLNTLTPAKCLAICNYITTKTTRFSADVVGVSGDGRAFKRLRAVYDVSGTSPQMLYCKDLTHLGWPLDPQILDDLRVGRAPVPSSQSTGLNTGSSASGGSTSGSSLNLGGSH